MKIHDISLGNFRGVRAPISLGLESGCSLLLYGDNGSGKSSFADAVEWFVTDSISHLSGEEIESYGGIRNALCAPTEECFAEINFASSNKNKRTLSYVKDKLKSKFEDPQKTEFVEGLKHERLWIRNRGLVEFILANKGDRLADISDIIGFEVITKSKATLKKSANEIKAILKGRNFENQIAQKKSLLLDKLKATVNDEKQFYAAINSQVAEFKLGYEVADKTTLDRAFSDLKTGIDSSVIKARSILEITKKKVAEENTTLVQLSLDTESLKLKLIDLRKDKDNLKNVSLSRLLDEAEKILKDNGSDECPLCLQDIDRKKLLATVQTRLLAFKKLQQQLKIAQDERQKLLLAYRAFYRAIDEQIKALTILQLKEISLDAAIEILKDIELIEKTLNLELMEVDPDKLNLNLDSRSKILSDLSDSVGIVLSSKSDNSSMKIDLISRISVSEIAFSEILKLEKEKIVLEDQKLTLEKIYLKFADVQRTEMASFLKSISMLVNEYYVFMNDNEKVESIEMVAVDNSDGEFVGIQVKLKFHGQAVNSAKQFLSESHVNCIGLCIFLASVKLFNKSSKFFVLDDVISSFDKAHRLRFGQLLTNRFADYQILLLTHESEWFEFMHSEVKGRGWKISKTNWNAEDGISFELPSADLKTQIEEKIKGNKEDGLGNLLRRFGERVFKELCSVLEAPIAFRFNDEQNENRTLDEFFLALKSRIKDKTDLSKAEVISRLSASKFVTNRTSHDSTYRETIHDCKPVYKDFLEFDELFRCLECNRRVSLENFNLAKKVISCKCGKKEIAWKV